MLDVKDQWPDIFVSRVPKILKPVVKWCSKIISPNLKL